MKGGAGRRGLKSQFIQGGQPEGLDLQFSLVGQRRAVPPLMLSQMLSFLFFPGVTAGSPQVQARGAPEEGPPGLCTPTLGTEASQGTREKTPMGAAARGNPLDAPVLAS